GVQVITVQDTTPPVISYCPNDSAYQCLGEVLPGDPDSVVADDNCDDDLDKSMTADTLIKDPDCWYEITRTYTVEDNCGNIATCTQVITVKDTEAPTITSCPKDSSYQCLDDVPEAVADSVQATDNCDNDLDKSVVVDTLVIEPDCWYEITRTYTVEDDCGNTASCDQVITVRDTIPPEITCPDSVDIMVDPEAGECYGSVADLDSATATDNCGIPTVTRDPESFPIGTSWVVWTATDDCGNTASCSTQTVTVRMWVDIKPTSCPNPLNVGDSTSAVVPMAIEGCDGFDVSDIDTTAVLVLGITPFNFNYEDVSAPPYAREDSCDCDELGADGFEDLTFKVHRDELIDSLEAKYGSLEKGQVVMVDVTAETHDGEPLEGRDCMVVRGVPEPGPQAALERRAIPKVFGLGQNRPNPLHGVTIIHYQLPTTATASLRIYDVTGRLIKTLASVTRRPGYYTEMWDATDDKGQEVPSGVYFYTMRAGSHVFTKQMILIR
ncbi:HYR domain-containing protein, partial [candidate division TA06 bacterium]